VDITSVYSNARNPWPGMELDEPKSLESPCKILYVKENG
jgi:hypothetical protein